MKRILRSEHTLSADINLYLDIFGLVGDLYVTVHVNIEISHQKVVRGVIRPLEKKVLFGLC